VGFIGGLLNFLLVLSSIFLICLVLIQRGRGGGLAGAFGGVGGSSAFGTKAGDVFTRVTIVTAAVWFLLAIFQVVLNNQGRTSAFDVSGEGNRTVPITGGAAGKTAGKTATTPPAPVGAGAGTAPATAPAPAVGTTPPTSPAPSPAPAATGAAKADSSLPAVFEDEKATPAPAPTAPAPAPEPAKAP
jgi:preprotein translocase subunit SecG